jgi:hypothetical protein
MTKFIMYYYNHRPLNKSHLEHVCCHACLRIKFNGAKKVEIYKYMRLQRDNNAWFVYKFIGL